MNKNFCSSCGEKINVCQCKVIDNKKDVSCGAMHLGARCGKTINLFQIAAGKYWCEFHYEELHPKNDIQRELEKRVKVDIEAAKFAKMSVREFCEDKYPEIFKTFEPKKSDEQVEAVKGYLSKKNPLFANLGK